MRRIATVLILCCVLVFLGCPWKECTSPERCYTAYHTILSMNSIYNIGDTIWITSEMDCTNMHSLVTNTVDIFCDAEFSFPLGCVQILDRYDRTFEGGVPKFEFIAKKGKVFNDTSIPRPEFNNHDSLSTQFILIYELKKSYFLCLYANIFIKLNYFCGYNTNK